MSPLDGANEGSCGQPSCSLCHDIDFRPKAFPPRGLVPAGVLSAVVRVVDQDRGRVASRHRPLKGHQGQAGVDATHPGNEKRAARDSARMDAAGMPRSGTGRSSIYRLAGAEDHARRRSA